MQRDERRGQSVHETHLVARSTLSPMQRGHQVEPGYARAADQRRRERGVLAGGIGHRVNGLREQGFDALRVLGSQTSEKALEHGTMALAKLGRRKAAAAV